MTRSSMTRSRFKPGDVVVYRKQKCTTHPGPRAQQVDASSKGELYTYVVDKFWVVDQVLESGDLVLLTRRGKTHIVDHADPHLRRMSLWDRLWHPSRIAELQHRDAIRTDRAKPSAA